MNLIYFICPETPQLAKYCEGFYNYLTYGYRTWTRDKYAHSTSNDKTGKSRMLMKKNVPQIEEMKANDRVFDRIYEKVITSDCYEHFYSRISKEDIDNSKLILYITSNKNSTKPPQYLYTNNNSVIVWKISNIDKLSNNKYNLLESLIRRVAKSKD
jgi:hypothetical protein